VKSAGTRERQDVDSCKNETVFVYLDRDLDLAMACLWIAKLLPTSVPGTETSKMIVIYAALKCRI
jgi:hypothetical protein